MTLTTEHPFIFDTVTFVVALKEKRDSAQWHHTAAYDCITNMTTINFVTPYFLQQFYHLFGHADLSRQLQWESVPWESVIIGCI